MLILSLVSDLAEGSGVSLRPLRKREREILVAITAGDLPGLSELRKQLPLARVRRNWGSGESPSIDIEVPGSTPVHRDLTNGWVASNRCSGTGYAKPDLRRFAARGCRSLSAAGTHLTGRSRGVLALGAAGG